MSEVKRVRLQKQIVYTYKGSDSSHQSISSRGKSAGLQITSIIDSESAPSSTTITNTEISISCQEVVLLNPINFRQLKKGNDIYTMLSDHL